LYCALREPASPPRKYRRSRRDELVHRTTCENAPFASIFRTMNLFVEACLKRAHRKLFMARDATSHESNASRTWRECDSKDTPSPRFRQAGVSSPYMSRIVACGNTVDRVNPGLKTLPCACVAALPKIAVIIRGCGTIEPSRCKTSSKSKSTDAIEYIKKQLETNKQQQEHIAIASLRALDRKSAIVTVLLK
jgi:hypothetical protein